LFQPDPKSWRKKKLHSQFHKLLTPNSLIRQPFLASCLAREDERSLFQFPLFSHWPFLEQPQGTLFVLLLFFVLKIVVFVTVQCFIVFISMRSTILFWFCHFFFLWVKCVRFSEFKLLALWVNVFDSQSLCFWCCSGVWKGEKAAR